MTTEVLLEQTEELLRNSVPKEQYLNGKIRRLVEAKCLRELSRYRRTDMGYKRKYGVIFDEFLKQRIVRKLDYTWEVEQDAMDWETAVSGMETAKRKLQELRADS